MTKNIVVNTDRFIDPNVLQRQASDPHDSVWVGASAGSGKTKVLTDRILRLLLPHKNGEVGAEPQKILALTFTKIAASEMSLRISARLSQWAVIPATELEDSLKTLLGYAPTEQQQQKARRLFASVVDSPGGLKIMTIHSFCQSVLSRFPLEAGLPPQFNALEEYQSKEFLQEVIETILKNAEQQKGSPLSDAINHLAQHQNQDQFIAIIRNLLSEQRQMKEILKSSFGVNGLYENICQTLNIKSGISGEEYILQNIQDDGFNSDSLWDVCKALGGSDKKTDLAMGIGIQNFLEQNPVGRVKYFKDYQSLFLTNNEDIRKSLATKNIQNNHADLYDILLIESQRIFKLTQDLKAIQTTTLTRDLFFIGTEIIDAYQTIKQTKNALDFDDLIHRTVDLLKGNTSPLNGLTAAPWIRFKMDDGLDHILVDEAQDTNPEQWEIIQTLCDDFFDGNTKDEKLRSIFVVGDEKQSIFSFQRASPEKFKEMRQWFANKIKNINEELQAVDFVTSFRSAPSILKFVDKVFDGDDMRKGLSDIPIHHHSYRYTQASQVELWPLFENNDKADHDPWSPAIEVKESSNGAAKLANHIGDTVQRWITEKEILESYDRPIQAGDIMILVRSRSNFINQVVRALKVRNIAVSGVDRMILRDQLVVQDLCALAEFALLPDDDLTLATILKSPFIGMSEEDLFTISFERQSSLWASLKNHSEFTAIIKWLEFLISAVAKQSPYQFFNNILQKSCPADDISGLRAVKKRLGEECLDPLNEFLNTALEYEAKHSPNLQNFIQSMLYDETEIKRQMEEGNNAVRIMTIHGAKGLQAPIVILPDTTRTSSSNQIDRIFWPDRTDAPYPFFCPTSKNLPDLCEQAKATWQMRANEEYKRLFYVALTRAEHRLYIGGYKTSKPVIDESWYTYTQNAFQNLEDVQERPLNDDSDAVIYRYHNEATDKPDRQQEHIEDNKADIMVPGWLFTPMPEEPNPPKTLMPSRPSESESGALSPLQSQDQSRFKRGNITHKLLQILPELPQENRIEAAQHFVAQPAHDLKEHIQADIVKEVMNILDHPDFAPIFGEGSVAEAPITGLLDNNRLISGQIDRLLVTPDQVFIIDYKSNRPPPHDVKDVPLIYKNQMQAYADVMRHIYPDRDIKCALLWTDGCRLMPLDDIT